MDRSCGCHRSHALQFNFFNKDSASSNKHLGAVHVLYFNFSHLEKALG